MARAFLLRLQPHGVSRGRCKVSKRLAETGLGPGQVIETLASLVSSLAQGRAAGGLLTDRLAQAAAGGSTDAALLLEAQAAITAMQRALADGTVRLEQARRLLAATQ